MEVLLNNSTEPPSKHSSDSTGEGVIIDIGTGDGAFVYQSARENPRRFYIGIDPNTRPLAKISEKIHRKPSKGGAPNVLFVQASLQDLPAELDEVADEIHIHFPWGSLLQAVATGDVALLKNLRRICAPNGMLEVVTALDPERDRSEIERLDLSTLSNDMIDTVLSPRYAEAGFEIVERGVFAADEWPKISSSWAKRLKGNKQRTITYLIAHAVTVENSPASRR